MKTELGRFAGGGEPARSGRLNKQGAPRTHQREIIFGPRDMVEVVRENAECDVRDSLDTGLMIGTGVVSVAS